MERSTFASPAELVEFTGYLTTLVRLQIEPQLQSKLDPSGIVQQTLLEAHRAWEQLQSRSKGELAVWLRLALAHNVMDELRKCGVRKLGQERSLEQALQDSSARLEKWLVAEQSSPSERTIRVEHTLRLATALAELPDKQRQVVELRHLRGASLAEIAGVLGCSKSAVVGLLYRGVRRLREALAKGGD